MNGVTSPPWGSFPAEQYLIRKWNPSSNLSPNDQIRELIRSFMTMDEIPAEWRAGRNGTISRIPTTEEVREILQPWRPDKIRKIADQLLHETCDNLVVLRTCYDSEGGDEKMQQLITQEEDADGMGFLHEELWWRYLDDRELFDFGDDWSRVFDLLPELVGHSGRRRSIEPAKLAEARASENPEDDIQYLALSDRPLLIASRDVLESDDEPEYEVVFLDGYGNPVRYSSVGPEDMMYLRMAPQRGMQLSQWWADGDVAEPYEADGEMGRVLYRAAET
ncbi:hypothetical protein COL26b_013649 [Colletotrichum chrysophilum]|uniref:uncharacterized protein n=1 Tax=Colletotrichum chrysophilum TaxID=1836956 RepID=UPI0023000B1F|nr:uncharacterized protein COL26b_013649 [Colletotrichum chrysophilum]KAJ0361675.1 hypothetical protein COL26b_013649 [Colletotrichum chrysophilum]